MQKTQRLIWSGLASLLILTACSNTPAEPTPNSSQPVVVTEDVAPPSTDTPSPEPTTANREPATVIPPDTPTVAMIAEESSETPAEATPTEEMMAPTVTPTPEEIDWQMVEGRTENNLPYLGNPEAPVTIIDYSDFL